MFVPWFWQSEYKKVIPEGTVFTDEEMLLLEFYDLSKEQLFWRRMKVAELTTDGVDGARAFKQEYPMNAAEAFQVSGGDGLIKADHCMVARKRKVTGSGPLVIGVDPSRGGDRFAIVKRQSRKMYGMESYKGEQCDKLGKNVAICIELLDTVDEQAGKVLDMMFVDAGGGAEIVD